MSLIWVCAKDGTPVDGAWCDKCSSDVLAVQVPTASGVQLRIIWELLASRGEVNRNRRLDHIGRILGRHLTDYDHITHEEAGTKVIPALRKWSRGV